MNSFEKLPQTALAFYAKIYCKKRGVVKAKSNNMLIEATKSWLSLSINEKQKFLSKYQEFKKYYRTTFAKQLKKAEPYLKKKFSKENKERNSVQNENNSSTNKDIVIDANSEAIPHFNDELSSYDNYNTVKSPLHHQNEIEYSLHSPVIASHPDEMQNHLVQIIEPTPPKLLTGKELFDRINENEDLNWNDLPVREKRRYTNAVLTIKKNYLKEYRNYLEHLSSEKLYYYYKSKTKI